MMLADDSGHWKRMRGFSARLLVNYDGMPAILMRNRSQAEPEPKYQV